jgi:SAM-dependent methyltransferase
MQISRSARTSLLAFCLSAVAGTLLAQAPSRPRPVEPKVGQDGKDVVWVPTSQALVEKMLDLAKVTPEDYVLDLGSGDGRTVIAAAKRGAMALGIEYNPDMVELSKRNAAAAGLSYRATFVNADLFQSDFSRATVITMFLLPTINLKLRPTFLKLKPGTRLVSNSFTMGEWTADGVETLTEDCVSWCKALLWIVPAQASGTWRLPQGELTLEQDFQKLSGSLMAAGHTTPIAEGRLRGDQISFRVAGVQYAGRVTDNAMEGTFWSGDRNGSWSATRTGR